jgi:hypothetical protein
VPWSRTENRFKRFWGMRSPSPRMNPGVNRILSRLPPPSPDISPAYSILAHSQYLSYSVFAAG